MCAQRLGSKAIMFKIGCSKIASNAIPAVCKINCIIVLNAIQSEYRVQLLIFLEEKKEGSYLMTNLPPKIGSSPITSKRMVIGSMMNAIPT